MAVFRECNGRGIFLKRGVFIKFFLKPWSLLCNKKDREERGEKNSSKNCGKKLPYFLVTEHCPRNKWTQVRRGAKKKK